MYLNSKGLFKSLKETKEQIAQAIHADPQHLKGSIFMLGMDCDSIPKELHDNPEVDFLILDAPQQPLHFVVVQYNVHHKENKRPELEFKSANKYPLNDILSAAYQALQEKEYERNQETV